MPGISRTVPIADALPAQALGLGLHVADVEGEDGLLVHFVLPFGDRDLGAPADEPRPAVGLVHVGLVEPERAAVERPGRVEIPDAEPDRHYKARPGSSRNCLTVRRNSDAVAPSTVR